ncbi:hypothetical protein Q4534_08485 [Cyclobacterium sp. 1_MG-2023]|uniref:hypothetical protein n=1 Tax=Cyclobacterium sp. 1_MG-2023 TaxID=3062681 RepID=UPI0026E16659|nr:hypothetical protein [Cyclobacterium sp. 1_MG-2023]MDO6437439.1 hypothetical protein [Cyclobacterium sp. 1_MG-2023]
MLQTLHPDQSPQVNWLHACRNQTVHAFKQDIHKMAETHPNMRQHIFYDALTEKDKKDGVIQGPLDLNKIDPIPKKSQYYICGPTGFIAQQYKILIDKGVAVSDISYEEFGPQSLNLN